MTEMEEALKLGEDLEGARAGAFCKMFGVYEAEKVRWRVICESFINEMMAEADLDHSTLPTRQAVREALAGGRKWVISLDAQAFSDPLALDLGVPLQRFFRLSKGTAIEGQP